MLTQKFCPKCGTKMSFESKPVGFNEDTGQRRFFVFFTCPNATPRRNNWFLGTVGGNGHPYRVAVGNTPIEDAGMSDRTWTYFTSEEVSALDIS
jgi:hypothetical protein